MHKIHKIRLQNVHLILCFSLKCCDFSELWKFCCCAGVLPALCVYKHWHRGKTKYGKSPLYFKIFQKNTIFNEHPVHIYQIYKYQRSFWDPKLRWYILIHLILFCSKLPPLRITLSVWSLYHFIACSAIRSTCWYHIPPRLLSKVFLRSKICKIQNN